MVGAVGLGVRALLPALRPDWNGHGETPVSLQKRRPRVKDTLPRLPGDIPPVQAKKRRGKMVAPGTIRSRSAARAEDERYYRVLRRVWLGGRCEALLEGCDGRAGQVHHMRGRIGSLLCDVEWWLGVCAHCHQMITEHKIDPYAAGLSFHRNATTGEPRKMSRYALCKSCQAPMYWVKRADNGKSIPLIADEGTKLPKVQPDGGGAGRIQAVDPSDLNAGVHVMKKDEMAMPDQPVWLSHFVDCPEGKGWKKR